MNLESRWRLQLWQIVFLLISTSWLLAPHFNHFISYRTGLISQFELPGQPYSAIFRLCDFIGGFLLLAVAISYHKQKAKRSACLLLALIGIGLMADPLLSTTCHVANGVCVEYVSLPFLLHALETITTSLAIFALAIYDSRQRRRVVSIGFVLFQVLYALLFISQLATQNRFNTFSQFFYQLTLTVWLCWFVRDYIVSPSKPRQTNKLAYVKNAVAFWAFANGILSIILSLADIQLIGKLKGLYFAGDSAWLAQHGMIVGVVLIYLSRHLRRGESRARHLFLIITALETLKYSVITPHPGLMLLYFGTFCAVYVLKDAFDRGTAALTWRLRFKEVAFLSVSLFIAALVSVTILYSNRHGSIVASQAVDHYFDYVAGSRFTPDSKLESALLAHSASAFILPAVIAIMWVLFKPARRLPKNLDSTEAKNLLKAHSNSSEDFFKLWPSDKQYFYGDGGFIAYKITGPIAFALADPISDAGHRGRLLDDFLDYCKSHSFRVAFLPIFENSLKLYEKRNLNIIQIGASAVIDVQLFLDQTVRDKWWRWKNNKATKAGFSYENSSPPHSRQFMEQLKQASDSWLAKDGRQERGFALGYYNEAYLQKCVIHFLKDDQGRLAAFTNQIPQLKENGSITVDLLRHLPEAGEAMPFLLYKTIEKIGSENYKQFDLGFVPFAATDDALAKVIKSVSTGRFSAKGLEQFKNKFDPDWQPNYLAYDGDLADLALVALNIERAMDVK